MKTKDVCEFFGLKDIANEDIIILKVCGKEDIHIKVSDLHSMKVIDGELDYKELKQEQGCIDSCKQDTRNKYDDHFSKTERDQLIKTGDDVAKKVLDSPIGEVRAYGSEKFYLNNKEREGLDAYRQDAYEQDPHGLSAHEQGSKLDKNKIDTSFLLDFNQALLCVAMVSMHGAEKYTRGGWLKVPEGYRRYTAAMLRHILDEQRELYDGDSELLHAAHTAWNALARLELYLREKEEVKI